MNFTKVPNINYFWTNLIVEELIRCGVDYFCVAPGSRSSPLALAVAESIARHQLSKKIAKLVTGTGFLNFEEKPVPVTSFVHFDERGLGFHALGYVSATKRPCAIITTSGTAVANLFPAVIEASKKKLPLIVLTADRPPELRFTGANQTIDQVKIFGEYVRWQFDMPCPTEEITPEFVLTTIDQAVYQSQGRPPGPVHLNCMFREPLIPKSSDRHQLSQLSKKLVPVTTFLKSWSGSAEPYTRYTTSELIPSHDSLNEVAGSINRIKNGLIIVGKLGSPADREAVLKLSEKLNWPIFADISSGLRLGVRHKNLIHYFDQILVGTRHAWSLQKIDGIIHLGGRMTSKRLSTFLENARPSEYIMVLNHPLRNDPSHQVTLRVESTASEFWRLIGGRIHQKKSTTNLALLQKANQTTDNCFKSSLDNRDDLTEPSVARLISQHITADSGLFIGNSLPIREMDMFASPNGPTVTVTANRGASGIDGNIATACGFASGLNKPVTIFLGDLALLYDLNSLSMTKELKKPFTVVVLNNDGGGIFSFLPVADSDPQTFERFFATPHGLTFEHAARMFRLHYMKPTTQNEFIENYARAQKSKTPTVIEIQTDRLVNVKIHNQLQSMMKKIFERR